MQSLLSLPRPLGAPYAQLMKARRRLYENGRLASYAPQCPTVSVGNIAMGGTGKTPVVSYLLSKAEKEGLKAVVLTRGYKGKPGSVPLLVGADTPVSASGDEALMLGRMHPAARVMVFPQRAVSARQAEEQLAPDLFILDDGMQHLAVRRDVNIVLLRPADLDEAWDRVLPAGPWREGASALASASAFALKASQATARLIGEMAKTRLGAFGKPLFFFDLKPTGLRPLFERSPQSGSGIGLGAGLGTGVGTGLANGPETPPPHAGGHAQGAQDAAALPALLPREAYRDVPYILLSGVGNPQGLADTAALFMGRAPVRHFDFADHHAYTARDIQAVLALSPVPLPVVCTRKDAVKLLGFQDIFAATPVWVLESAVEFGPCLFSGGSFDDWYAGACAAARERRNIARPQSVCTQTAHQDTTRAGSDLS